VSLVAAQPFEAKKKGADTGIDGVKLFRGLDQPCAIAGLLNQTQRPEHPDGEPDLNCKRARAEAHGQQTELI
jgi:hypothetical protein